MDVFVERLQYCSAVVGFRTPLPILSDDEVTFMVTFRNLSRNSEVIFHLDNSAVGSFPVPVLLNAGEFYSVDARATIRTILLSRQLGRQTSWDTEIGATVTGTSGANEGTTCVNGTSGSSGANTASRNRETSWLAETKKRARIIGDILYLYIFVYIFIASITNSIQRKSYNWIDKNYLKSIYRYFTK